MAGRMLACLLLFALLVSLLPVHADDTQPLPVLRALLVSCDDFVTQPDTMPSSYNNLIALRRALLYDIRGYRSIRVSVNRALDRGSLASLAAEAYAGASQEDISLFYLSTHGVTVKDNEDFAALLSDGFEERILYGQDIAEALGAIPGKKVVVLDACFSGAAIAKGLDDPRVASAFSGPDFKVLTSAGGLEPSFLWTDGAGTVQGGSFFAQALTEGITAEGRYAADQNRDGLITLRELHAHQLSAYGASTPQAYPENDDFVVFAYRIGHQANDLRTVTGLEVESPLISEHGQPIRFSYTLNRQARLAYQLVYEHEGAWRFRVPQSIIEAGRGDGIVLPGRKEAALGLQPGMGGLSGYLLLMLVSVYEDRASPQACVLLSVQTRDQPQEIRVDNAPAFTPGAGEEAAFIVRHLGAVTLSAQVLDHTGERVAVLATRQMSRPLHLRQEGTCLWWDGRGMDGKAMPAGVYRLQVTVYSGSRTYEIQGAPFELLAPS
jgi:hypothetical protein